MKDEGRYERQLDELLGRLEVEQAPPGLTRRLRRIPAEQGHGRARWWSLFTSPPAPRWVLAPALAAAVLAVGIVTLLPRQPSAVEVEQARRELAMAFNYIDRAGLRTGQEIHQVLDTEVSEIVKDSLARNIPFTEQSRKEKSS